MPHNCVNAEILTIVAGKQFAGKNFYFCIQINNRKRTNWSVFRKRNIT
jgi:hypothetical protein